MAELDCRAMTRRLIAAGYQPEVIKWASWNMRMQERSQSLTATVEAKLGYQQNTRRRASGK